MVWWKNTVTPFPLVADHKQKIMRRIYLDYNATTPLHPEVIKKMQKYMYEYFGNPSSSHWAGKKPKEAVKNAREQVAELLNCSPEEIVFTSGGSESNNFAIKGIAFLRKSKGNHIITTQIEHPAVLEVCKYLEKFNFKITYLPVDNYGMLNIKILEKAITPETILVSVMHANNEVGTIQPVEEISKITKKHSIIFHTDAAQSAGKIPTDVKKLGVDLLSIAGHKLYAPKGIGVLFIKKGIELEKFMHGAGQEQGKRAGTENVIEIAGLGVACEIAVNDIKTNMQKLKNLRDKIFIGIKNIIEDVRLNGHLDKRLPNTLSLSFKGIRANELIKKTEDYLAVSAGAACHSGKSEISYVLKAMNVPEDWAIGTIRISTGRFTDENDVKNAVNIIVKAISELKKKLIQL